MSIKLHMKFKFPFIIIFQLILLVSISACRNIGSVSMNFFGSKDISFSPATQNIFEEAGSGSVLVTLKEAATSETIVNYQIVAASADNSDYIVADGTLTFAVGEISKTITFSIVNDAAIETDEVFSIRLVSMSKKGKIKTISEAHPVTILDNDLPAGTVLEVTSSSADGAYRVGSVVSIQVVFSQVVTVNTSGGSPQLLLETGATDRLVNYSSGSGTNTLTFNYTVQAGDTSSDLQYFDVNSLTLNGSSIKNSGRNNMILTLPTLPSSDSLAQNKNLVIDTTDPAAPTGFSDGIIYYSATVSSPFLQVASTDAGGSGIAGYEIKMGTTLGGTEVTDWVSSGNTLWAQIVASFNPFTRYFTSIRAIDNAGNKSSVVDGDGWWSLNQSKLTDEKSYPLRLQTRNKNFGTVLSVSDDGLTLAVGQPSEDYDQNGLNVTKSAGAVFVYTYAGGVWNFVQKVVAPSREEFAAFGTTVGISSNTLVVGATGDKFDSAGLNPLVTAGAVYVYELSGGVWTFSQKVTPTGTNARRINDQFGGELLLSGTNLFVGSKNGYDELGSNPLTEAGSVFYFRKVGSQWVQGQKIVATGTNARMASDYFGSQCWNNCLAMSDDTLVVGAPGQDYDAVGGAMLSNAGAAYTFVYNSTTNLWEPEAKIVSSGLNGRLAGDGFGESIALDQDTLFVAAPYQAYDAAGGSFTSSAGAVYAFGRSGSVWTQTQKIIGEGVGGRGANENFGRGLGFDGVNLLVGSASGRDAAGGNFIGASGAVTHYTFGTTWGLHNKYLASHRASSDFFGQYLDLKSGHLVIAATSHALDANGLNSMQGSGAIFSFALSGSNYVEESKLVLVPISGSLRHGASGGESGSNVALSEDQQTMVVNAQDGTVSGLLVYVRSGNTWILEQKISLPLSQFQLNSYELAISSDRIVIGFPDDTFDSAGANPIAFAGSVVVYKKTAGVWSLEQKITPTGVNARGIFDNFGTSLVLSGNNLIVGSKNSYDAAGANNVMYAGAIWHFEFDGATWTQRQKIVAPVRTSSTFGLYTAISGSTLVVSEYGNTHVYKYDGASWALEQTLALSGLGANLGGPVAIDGNRLVVGSTSHEYDLNDANQVSGAGAAWTFTRSGVLWTQESKLVASGVNARQVSDNFGYSVSISGDLIAVGAPYTEIDHNGLTPVENSGSIYLFQLTGTGWNLQQRLVPTGLNARNANDRFGADLKIVNRTLVVGSPGHDFDISGDDPAYNSGAVYVYYH